MKRLLLGTALVILCCCSASCARILPDVGRAVVATTITVVASAVVDASIDHLAESARQNREYRWQTEHPRPLHPGTVEFQAEERAYLARLDQRQARARRPTPSAQPERSVPQAVDRERPPRH